MKDSLNIKQGAVLPQWMTVEQLASYLQLSKSTIYKMVFYRKLPYYKPTNKLLYFKKAEVDETIEKSRISEISPKPF